MAAWRVASMAARGGCAARRRGQRAWRCAAPPAGRLARGGARAGRGRRSARRGHGRAAPRRGRAQGERERRNGDGANASARVR
jgi:hypothetical protein